MELANVAPETPISMSKRLEQMDFESGNVDQTINNLIALDILNNHEGTKINREQIKLKKAISKKLRNDIKGAADWGNQKIFLTAQFAGIAANGVGLGCSVWTGTADRKAAQLYATWAQLGNGLTQPVSTIAKDSNDSEKTARQTIQQSVKSDEDNDRGQVSQGEQSQQTKEQQRQAILDKKSQVTGEMNR